jgi:transcriptional regulator with XRE-family HTH domain
MLTQQLGEALKAERERQGLTQKDVAERMGKHTSFVQAIEYHSRDFRVSSYERYAEALDFVSLEVSVLHT